jgi:phenylacetate-CoA ligase
VNSISRTAGRSRGLLQASGKDLLEPMALLRADPRTIRACAGHAICGHLAAYSRTRYGREALRRAGIEPDRARVEDLARLEPLTKPVLRDRFPDLNLLGMTLAQAEVITARLAGGREITRASRPDARQVEALVTSGTQGLRSVILTSPEQLLRDHQQVLALTFDAVREAGLLAKGLVRVLAVVGSGASHVSNVSARILARLPFIDVTVVSANEPGERLVERVRRIRPDVVVAYASRLRVLVEAQTRGDLAWGRPLLFSGAEILHQETIETAARLGWPCWDTYGTTETGTIAAGRAGDMRVLPCDVVVEPVDRDGNPVPPGAWSDAVLVTKLTGGIQPLVRFWLDDEVRLLDLGEALPRVEIRGRSHSPWLWPDGVSVEVRALRQVLDEAGVAECVARQTARGMRAEVSPAPGRVIDAGRVERQLASVLRAAGIAGPQVVLTPRASVRAEYGTKAGLKWIPLDNKVAP